MKTLLVGNHDQAYTVNMGNCNTQNCLVHPNGVAVLTVILDLHFWSDDSSNKIGSAPK